MLTLSPQLIQQAIKNTKTRKYGEYFISKWDVNDASDLYRLEVKTWAPWLRKPMKNFETIAKIFPNGQRKITNGKGEIVAAVTTNLVNWDGNTNTLLSWDSYAGGSIAASDYSGSYLQDGNTLDFVSISVDPALQGKGLANVLVREVIDFAQNLGVEHLICSLRPSGYGEFKLKPQNESIGLIEYCKLTGPDGFPIDPWLRIAANFYMLPQRIENEAIKVEVSIDKFKDFRRTYNNHKWRQNKYGSWECGEAGIWSIKSKSAVYIEPNLWVEIPLR